MSDDHNTGGYFPCAKGVFAGMDEPRRAASTCRLIDMAVRLCDVVDALTMGDPVRHYYDRQADGLVFVLEDELAAVENMEEGDDLPDVAKGTASGDVELALRIVEGEQDAFVPLPSEWDIHMRSIMVDFADTLPESEARRRMWDGLHRQGAFRRFKDVVYRFDLADAWYCYRDDRLAVIARHWAQDKDVPLADEP